MRIAEATLYRVKSFDEITNVVFDKNQTLFSCSGKNGSGKSTILRSLWVVQKLHFCEQLNDGLESAVAQEDAKRLLNGPDSYIILKIQHKEEFAEIKVSYLNNRVTVNYENKELVDSLWDCKRPENLILFVDASKGFSEDTLRFDEINIGKNNKNDLSIEAILHPESLFIGIYRQLVKDYIHGRLIPSVPDRLLYYRVASQMFSQLIPNVELKNFSGNHKPGEFVLLGKANADKRKPLYDVRDFSSGEKALLSTLVFLCISKSVNTLIIDEPENHFHEGLLLEFIGMLKELCTQGGILNWAKQAKIAIKEDLLEQEYGGHNLSQIIYSTHSKSLIYKTFSLGQNFMVDKKISTINYDEAETELRKLGLSTVYNKVIFVEGDGDNEALNYITKNKNITIRPLTGSLAVIETFKRIATVRQYVQESEFVFVVDSDNKPAEYFDQLRDIDQQFFDNNFVKLDRHELENYLLDPAIIKNVTDMYLGIQNNNSKKLTEKEILAKIVEVGKDSLIQVYKKELSLNFQQIVATKFSELIWGNKNFDWSSSEAIETQISNSLLPENIDALSLQLKKSTHKVFDDYVVASDTYIVERCDGKQVLGKLCSYYAQYSGADNRAFKRAIYDIALNSKKSALSLLVDKIIKPFFK
jgi:5S rRNA maturation endonuclease (ribonuclease M5)